MTIFDLYYVISSCVQNERFMFISYIQIGTSCEQYLYDVDLLFYKESTTKSIVRISKHPMTLVILIPLRDRM